MKKFQPTADPAITQLELETSWKTWVTPNTKGRLLGWGSDADWASTVEILKQHAGVTAPLTPEREIYTNEFVPSGAEYVPPQTA